ncbi:unnamed protein product, partial [Allacma fusca]
ISVLNALNLYKSTRDESTGRSF